MSAAYVDNDGNVRPLDGKAGEPIVVTAKDVQDPQTLAQMLQDIRRDLAEQKRAWAPRLLFRRDLVVDSTSTTKYRIEHGFGGRVNWYVARWQPTAAGTAPGLTEDAATDAGALVLVSGVAGTASILVEAAG